LSIEKNLMVHQAIWSDDIDKIFNQQFNVTGDFEAVYSDDTYLDLVRAWTKKYMKIEIINTDVTLTGSWNPTLSFTLGKVSFESRSQTTWNDEIVKQTTGFVWSFNNTDGYTIKASMITDRATV
jgi:hypothetical protein